MPTTATADDARNADLIVPGVWSSSAGNCRYLLHPLDDRTDFHFANLHRGGVTGYQRSFVQASATTNPESPPAPSVGPRSGRRRAASCGWGAGGLPAASGLADTHLQLQLGVAEEHTEHVAEIGDETAGTDRAASARDANRRTGRSTSLPGTAKSGRGGRVLEDRCLLRGLVVAVDLETR